VVSTRILKKLALLDEGISPVVAGGAGGVGGYMAGKHIINPLLESRKRSIIDKMLKGELNCRNRWVVPRQMRYLLEGCTDGRGSHRISNRRYVFTSQ
jgi:hypothetical protein